MFKLVIVTCAKMCDTEFGSEFDCEFVFFEDGELNRKTGTVHAGEKIVFEESDRKEVSFVACPAFVNAHTHLGDSIAKDPPFSGIELVMPGGYKFRMLEKYRSECKEAIEGSLNLSALSGVLRVYDFREGGTEGVKLLREADRMGLCVALGRPESEEGERSEEVLEIADGFGVSSVRDVGFEVAEYLREIARKRKKLFFIHAGEVDDGDVDGAIELEPDAIVHMNRARKDQIRRVFEEEIPVISCIRSNLFFDVANFDSYRLFAEYERWCLGTDNVMLASPSVLEEMHVASYAVRDDEKVFRAATCSLENGLNLGIVIFHRRINFSKSKNTLATLVRRACIEDIERIIPGKVFFE